MQKRQRLKTAHDKAKERNRQSKAANNSVTTIRRASPASRSGQVVNVPFSSRGPTSNKVHKSETAVETRNHNKNSSYSRAVDYNPMSDKDELLDEEALENIMIPQVRGGSELDETEEVGYNDVGGSLVTTEARIVGYYQKSGPGGEKAASFLSPLKSSLGVDSAQSGMMRSKSAPLYRSKSRKASLSPTKQAKATMRMPRVITDTLEDAFIATEGLVLATEDLR